MRIGSLGTMQEANALIGDEVREIVDVIAVVVFHPLTVVVHRVVVEATVADQAVPFSPPRWHVSSRILVQVFTEVACNRNTSPEVCGCPKSQSAVPDYCLSAERHSQAPRPIYPVSTWSQVLDSSVNLILVTPLVTPFISHMSDHLFYCRTIHHSHHPSIPHSYTPDSWLKPAKPLRFTTRCLPSSLPSRIQLATRFLGSTDFSSFSVITSPPIRVRSIVVSVSGMVL